MSRSKVWLAAAVAARCAPAGQAVILFDDASNFREVRGGDVPLSFTTGDNFQLGLSVTDSATGERPEGAIVKAQNTVTRMNRLHKAWLKVLLRC